MTEDGNVYPYIIILINYKNTMWNILAIGYYYLSVYSYDHWLSVLIDKK